MPIQGVKRGGRVIQGKKYIRFAGSGSAQVSVSESDQSDTVVVTISAAAGGPATSHSSLSSLAWTSSGHTGTNNYLPTWSGGVAALVDPGGAGFRGLLGTGTPGSGNYLRGDGSWQTVTSGVTDHAALSSNLAWTTSGHTGTDGRLAGWAAGSPALLDPGGATFRGLLGTGTPDSTTYLRGNGTWATPTASVSATTVEVDLGAAKWAGKFTITDAAIGATSKVLVWQAPGPYTGKGTRADEAELQPVQVISVEPAAGSAVVKWQTPPIVVAKMNAAAGGQPASAIIPGHKDMQAIGPNGSRRLGKVRGNVKFSYTIFA